MRAPNESRTVAIKGGVAKLFSFLPLSHRAKKFQSKCVFKVDVFHSCQLYYQKARLHGNERLKDQPEVRKICKKKISANLRKSRLAPKVRGADRT